MNHRDGLSLFDPGVNPLKVNFLHRYLAPGSCLDLGCGNGLYGEPILKICSSVLQADLVDRRNDAAKKFPFAVMDARVLPAQGLQVDNVVAFDIMEHLPDDTTFLQSLHALRPRRLVLSVPNEDDDALRRIHLTHEHHMDKTHVRAYTNAGLRQLLESNGFRVLTIDPARNDRVYDFATLLAEPGVLSRAAAFAITAQVKVLKKIGLLANPCIADWICAAERTA